MIPAGTDAPGFELPGLIDGARRPVALSEFLGEDVVILAFYPADFNPACGADSDLAELDLFTMQKDVEVLAVGPDTLYSHAAFAEEYDLHIPLLSDTSHEVAATYDVAFEDDIGQHLVERSVFVIDPDGVIQYAWSTQEMAELPRSDEIKDAIADTGGDDTAFARYRIGHAHYTEGRRAFTSAMGSYRDSEWMVAQSDFKRAREEFEEASDHFDSSARFVDDETDGAYYDRAQEKSTALWQAADWLSKSASEYSSGAGAEGQRLRDDAEQPLENARDLGEPIDPDEWPPDDDSDGWESILPEAEEHEKTLMVDIDDEVAEKPADDIETSGESSTDEGAASDVSTDDDPGGDEAIDDAELEEIAAELTASQPDNPEGEELEETPTSMVDAPPEQADGAALNDDSADGAAPPDDAAAEIDDSDLEAIEAEMEASQSAADAACQSDGEAEDSTDHEGDQPPDTDLGTAGDADSGLDGTPAAGEADASPETELDESAGAELDGSTDTGPDEPPGDAPADPHADLTSGGSSVAGTSRSLEPEDASKPGDARDSKPTDQDPAAADGELDERDPQDADPADEEDEVVLEDEPQGATDEDMADIPTADDLAAEDEDVENREEDGGGGGY